MQEGHSYFTKPDTFLRVGLIGNPVAHSLSAGLQQAALDELGIPARYELWETRENELEERVASLRSADCLGANITIPYKEAVLPLLDEVDAVARQIGAVNTIVQHNGSLFGYNTDAPGLLRALAEQGVGIQDGERITLEGYSVVLLGAGGAARGAAFALVGAGVTRLVIVNRSLERAQRLANEAQKGSTFQVLSLSEPDALVAYPRLLIINATSVGMHGAGGQARLEGARAVEEASPLPAEILARFGAETFVFDMVYQPTETRLIREARTLDLRAANGLAMLLQQGALAFRLWTGQTAPLEVMRSTLFYQDDNIKRITR